MSTELAISQGVLALIVSSSAWFTWRNYLAPNPLDNVPGPTSTSFLWGNLREMFNLFGREYHEMIFLRYGGIAKFTGLFGSRALFISDPTALHHIVLKDHAHWLESDDSLTMNMLVFGPSLASTIGDQHRRQRKMLNPVFSIAHMRNMVPIFKEIALTLRDSIAGQVRGGQAEINLLEWLTRVALELIGQSGLGYSFDSLKGTDSNPYSKAVKNLLPNMMETGIARLFLPTIVKFTSAGFRRAIAEVIPWATLQEMLTIVDLMDKTSKDLLNVKRRAIEGGDDALIQQVGQGKDIMSILLRANMSASDKDRLADDELVAQMTTLIFAAMDTTSSALSRTIDILSHRPDIQEKLRDEYKELKGDRDTVNYDDIMGLPFLDSVCRETLRLYPPVTYLPRVAGQDTTLPLANPVKGSEGQEINEILVPKGTTVVLSLLGANCHKEVWGEDSMEWKPERWLQPLPSTVTEAKIPGVYSHLMTFSGGGKSCIGFKFSQLEMKIVLSTLLESFEFSPAREIEWTMGLSTPRVKGSKGPFQFPVKVELLQDD